MGNKLANYRWKVKANHLCLDCQKLIIPKSQRCGSCANKLYGESNHHWKGGRSIIQQGYVYRLLRGDSRANSYGYVAEHRVVWEEANGPLPKDWIIHHLNGDKQDNRLENLEAMPRNKHQSQQGFRELYKRLKVLEQRVSLLEAENILLKAWQGFREESRK